MHTYIYRYTYKHYARCAGWWMLLAQLLFLPGAVAAAAPWITVVDDLNRSVKLSAPAQRIISLAPHITENLFAAGAGARIVGVMNHSDYPPAAAAITVVASHAHINLEAVIALAPDLVVAWPTAGLNPMLQKIEKLGYTMYYSAPKTSHGIIANIEEFAKLTDTIPHIQPAELRAEITATAAEFSRRPLLKVFYQIWDQPLITLNGEHIISRVLEMCGARNVFADSKIIAPRVSVESVLQSNPDIIMGGRTADSATDFAPWRKWKSLTATARDGFILTDSDIMNQPTARMILGIRGLCEQLDAHRRP